MRGFERRHDYRACGPVRGIWSANRQARARRGRSEMRMNQVTISSADVARSIAFYRRLGLALIVSKLPDYARLACPPDSEGPPPTLSVKYDPERAGTGGAAVYFECDDLDTRCAELSASGVRFTSVPADQRWLWREARLVDPDGNEICLYRAGSARLDPPWRIRPSDGTEAP